MRDHTKHPALPRRSRTKGPAALLALLVLTTTGVSTAQAAEAPATAPAHTFAAAVPPAKHGGQVADTIGQLEADHHVRIGAFALDTATGRTLSYRGDERFPALSTFKAMVCAAVLDRARHVEPGFMDKVVHWTKADEVDNSPLTEGRGEQGMTVAGLCHAAITRSDNTAGNLLLRQIDGPDGLTRYYRSLRDPFSRLDRWEPELNRWEPGERRDTTTPSAMGRDLARVSLTRALVPEDRAQLTSWLRATTTGDARIRAGLPEDWTVGDKTGTSDSYGSANDIAIAWPPSGRPVIIAIYTNHTAPVAATDEAVIKSTTTALVRGLGVPSA
ncbi:class A beta-lactamase [Streptomyces sp. NPDC006660]|uniref:class A beta-lactamase n=1 Tax=Streptomyces sp. NPDC006660 TaxID=3156901 RepID=UPI003403E1F6